MTRLRKGLWFALVAVVLVVFGYIALRSQEPVYQGKRLGVWLEDFAPGRWDRSSNHPASVAVRAMGTNAVPFLLKQIESPPSSIHRTLQKWNRKQSIIKFPFAQPSHKDLYAGFAMYALGPSAKPAFPRLTNLLFQRQTSLISAVALAGIGQEAVPPLLSALTNQDWNIRDNAAEGLGWLRSDSKVAVTALINTLNDNQANVRCAAVIALGQLGQYPELAVPELIKLLPNNDEMLSGCSAMSLGLFGEAAKEAIPALREALKDPRIHDDVAVALERISPGAKAAEEPK